MMGLIELSGVALRLKIAQPGKLFWAYGAAETHPGFDRSFGKVATRLRQ